VTAPEEPLVDAPWRQRAETQAIFNLLDGAAGRTRAVGGIVRDTLLGRAGAETDIDMATEILPQEVMDRARRAGIAAYPTGIEHGTVTLRLNDLTVEVTTLRQDRETDGRHAIVQFGTDWTRDAERRDFTLNALYAGMDGALFDPLGGLTDCLAGNVRFIGDADQRILEDRLRVYRFFRFSASHGGEKFDPEGLAATRRAAGDLSALSAERVGTEMVKMLDLPRIVRTIEIMVEASILEFPPALLAQLRNYEQVTLKPAVTGRLAFIGSALGMDSVQKRWRLSNERISKTNTSIKAAALISNGRNAEAAYRYPNVLDDALDIAATSSNWTKDKALAVHADLTQLQVPDFPISGDDLIGRGMKPGKDLGFELARLEREWIDSGFRLGREELLGMVRE
jgi:poly(A) polymerase